MQLLHKQSILGLEELDEAIHHAEMDQLMLEILDLPNYDCDIFVTVEEGSQKEPMAYESNLHRIFEIVEAQDIKNGVDALLTSDNHLAFRAYGQHYTSQGKEGNLTTLITVKCYGEGMAPIDMSKVLTAPKRAVDKSLSL
ncbi:hypothetical protein [Streptococcus merionis]|uniref:hypothetical protein n=1 Tax=Streptococcus merionis TaxID=400065 RepID=UPI0026ED9D90|nr:hypothetical protein [Streptococcus merionis]